jgi:simple sugar transport system permease protein
MNSNIVLAVVVSAIGFGTPLVLAGLGELLAERSGVLNLGVEGMMLIGAVTAFFVSYKMHGPSGLVLFVAVLAAMVAGITMALIHAFLSITIRVNQIVSGLAITIFAGIIGLSSYLGQVWNIGGVAGPHQFNNVDLLGLKNLSILGPLIFNEDVFVYMSWVLVAIVMYYLYRTRPGLYLRAVGENPAAADAMGINVTAYRYVHTLVGGAFAGLGGAYFTLGLGRLWTDGITSGFGWIAIALVIFAFWRPDLLVLGAYLFGIFSALGPTLETKNITVLPSEFYSALPFLMTVIALAAASTSWANRRVGSPASLGIPYTREEG